MITSPILSLILLFIIVSPFAGAAVLTALPMRSEKAIARIAILSTLLSTFCFFAAIGAWLFARILHGESSFSTPEIFLFHLGNYRFRAGLSLTAPAAAFLFLIQFTSGLVIRFSRIYMHREPGFRRFFAVVLMFQAAMALLTLATHLDLLFFAWEIVGLASFLLIAFYHERRAPVRNALKTFSIYRVADIGLFLSAFLELTSAHTGTGLLLLLAAAGKSAQFPFSFWIVRAMEGPTPSSALFYGALSINAGAYLLLKTYSIWSGSLAVHLAIAIIGLTTAILCSLFSRTQHTIKGQVGYASAAQVGIIFVEIAAGLQTLALIHMISNALFRCYQLLVSPSAVAYLLRRQTASGQTASGRTAISEEHSLFQRLLTREGRSTLFVFSISEGYLEDGLRFLFWRPLRKLSERLPKKLFFILTAAGLIAMAIGFNQAGHSIMSAYIIIGFAGLSSILSLASLKQSSRSIAWLFASALLISFSVWLGTHARTPTVFYVITISIASVFAVLGLNGKISSPRFATALGLMGVLGLSGFSLLPTFFGEDMLLSQAFQIHSAYALLLSCLFALNGYIAIRNFAQQIWISHFDTSL